MPMANITTMTDRGEPRILSLKTCRDDDNNDGCVCRYRNEHCADRHCFYFEFHQWMELCPRNSNEYVEASDSTRIADLTLEIKIFIRIMSRSSLLRRVKISMERWGQGQDVWLRDDLERGNLATSLHFCAWAQALYSADEVREYPEMMSQHERIHHGSLHFFL